MHRRPLSILRLNCALLLGLWAALLLFQPDQRDGLRGGDNLFIQGHYYAALDHYQHLAPSALRDIRLGMLRTIRGEYAQAERDLRRGLNQQLQPAERSMGLIYLGQVLAMRDQAYAAQWALLPPCAANPLMCEALGVAEVLRAAQAQRTHNDAAAYAAYRTALTLLPAGPWYDYAQRWMATLEAERDPTAALSLLQTPTPTYSATNPLLQPLLPNDAPNRTAILAALTNPPNEQALQLAELFLAVGRYAPAATWFAQVPKDGPHALAAAVGSAYAHWRLGDQPTALADLEHLVQTHPEEPRLQAMRALAYLAAERTSEVQALIDQLAAAPATAADAALAQASLAVAQRDYVAASVAYQQAIARSTPARRGAIALLVAQFHLTTAYDLCGPGLIAAEIAVTSFPQSAESWATVAIARQRCSTPESAIAAAQRALALAPRADVAYHLGLARIAQGDRGGARIALIQAADLAPASVWRMRAEAVLGQLR